MGAVGEVIYDNTQTAYGTFYPSLNEFGDDVIFSDNRTLTITNFQLEYYAYYTPTNTDRTVQVRFYENDGQTVVGAAGGEGENYKGPGTRIYQSDPLRVFPGYNVITLPGLSVPVKKRFTYTVEFENFSGAYLDQAGLKIFDPAVIGVGFKDFWQLAPADPEDPESELVWGPYHFPEMNPPGSFGVRIGATPGTEPAVVKVQGNEGGAGRVITYQGPSMESGVLEYSDDGETWLPLQRVTFLGQPVVAVDEEEGPGNRRYRVRMLAETMMQVMPGRWLANGAHSFPLMGPPGKRFAVEASTDLQNWFPIHTNSLASLGFQFSDTQAKLFTERRFYRTRLMPDPDITVTTQPLANGDVMMTFKGPRGRMVVIESSTDMVQWTVVTRSTFTFSNGSLTYVDRQKSADGQTLYYRALLMP
ncbi:MAG TPA: hypothetical protein P5555_18840 [Candidatus Paceibacterota bacterium]|nr:hypothetical protein [Verrucomicrobiota bacterium]HOX04323.1 hypothetical protein [Verrucomicrobiota bacterium]HRZ47241.1 hypothetical protein [Candidatus Paceibacterota bacterium]HRZ92835.1 hypothetical protein [Candidatus Paceibacterota bacterium]